MFHVDSNLKWKSLEIITCEGWMHEAIDISYTCVLIYLLLCLEQTCDAAFT